MSDKYQILVVEDEANLGATLTEYLSDHGHTVDLAQSCQQAKDLFQRKHQSPQIILMDIGLPDGDGIELAKEFRSIRQDFVLIFLSAQNDPNTKYLGLEMGAEDYITKPFDLRELMLRLDKAIVLHGKLTTYQDEIELASIKVRFKSYEATDAKGNLFPLGQKECAILELLYSHKNEVVSRDTMIETIWGVDAFPTNRTVDNYIVRLRKLLETDQTQDVEIKSIRGIGYQLRLKEEK